jgi:TP901 family phage tail tape measure protein
MKAGEAYIELHAQGDKLVSETRRASENAARSGESSMRKGFGGAFLGVGALATAGIGGGIAAGVGLGITSSLKLSASFETTMNQIQAATGLPVDGMTQLSDLAKKMGADTIFSANDAAQAMLDLSRAGLKPAEIQAGALQGAMNLAAIEGMNLSDAATVAANTMSQFGLEAKQIPSVIDALAGASTASTASVESLSVGLQQVGPSARGAGLSLNDTVGTLALFDKNALKGSDAGTSLKTMLMRLTPSTDEAAAAFDQYGVSLVNSDGSFKSIVEIAGILNKKLGGLKDVQREAALETMFGSDAQRAASILTREGAEGLIPLINSTRTAGEAQRLAAARTSGLSGAYERMKGSVETAGLAIGDVLNPAAVIVADTIGKGADAVAKFVPQLGGMFKSVSTGKGAFAGLIESLGGARDGIAKTIDSVKAFIENIMPNLKAFAQAFVDVVVPGIKSIVDVFTKDVLPAIQAFIPAVTPIVRFLIDVVGGVVISALKGALQFVKGFFQVFSGMLNIFAGLFSGDWSRLWNGVKSVFVGIWNAIVGGLRVFINVGFLGIFRKGFAFVKTLVSGGWNAIKGLFTRGIGSVVSFTNSLPGKLGAIMVKAWNLLRRLVSSGWAALRGLFSRGVSAVVSFVRTLPGKLSALFSSARSVMTRLVSSAWSAVRGLFSRGVSAVMSAIRGLPGRISSLFSTAKSRMTSLAGQAWSAVKSAFSRGVGNVMSTITGLPGKIAGAFGDAKNMLVGIGRDIIAGLLAGIDQMKDAVLNKAGDIANGIKDKISGALRINSPSKVTMTIGRYVSEGLAVGMDSERGKVDSAALRLASSAVPGVSAPNVSARRQLAGAGGGNAAGGGPLIGSLTLQGGDKSVHEQMEDVNFALRRIQRGGVYA